MLVDLGRNDLGRVAKPGSVKLERLMEIERFSHVMHMTSRVTAQVNDGLHRKLSIYFSVVSGIHTCPQSRLLYHRYV